MIWFVRDFDLLSLFLRALSFSCEALAFGGIFFLLFAARPAQASTEAQRHLRRIAGRFALALVFAQIALLATTSSELMGSAGLGMRDMASEPFFLASAVFACAALTLFFLLRITARLTPSIVALLVALSASVALSHAASRMDHRPLLLFFTAAHHLGMAAWIGALPFLLLALQRTSDPSIARRMARRFSTMAVIGVAVLILAGAGLSWFYAGSWHGFYGTSYGLLLSAKIAMTALILTLGAANFLALRRAGADPAPLLFRLRRFGETEIGLGFTVILAAASLTAQSPSVDETTQDTLTAHQALNRMEWRWPSFHTPAFAQLAPPTPLGVAVREAAYTGGSASDANDRAWSEYNHHWAGLIVLVAGLLALVSRLPRQQWARCWPLLFLGLSVFILMRADPECWPLGPRPFWASFTAPDVLEHRLYAVIIAVFAVFETGVQTGLLRWPRARCVFPILCAAGGALLLTHTHALGQGTDEVFAELSHTPMAVLGAVAGWGRWLELRLDEDAPAPQPRPRRIAAWVWPICLILIGVLLLNYRES
ncbi:MAG TPA: CopD family protein [Acidobacteriaceae bacterium]|nr:CopD family protein [Acidobacteriaceae bacterium]